MPNNYVLLDRIELNNTAATVTFDNIPQTGYTDLKIVCSIRDTGAGTQNNVIFRINSVTTSQSVRTLYGTGSGAPASYSDTPVYATGAVSNGATANTFSNVELYIPNYASTSAFKSVSIDTVTENNGTTGWQTLNAGLYASNSAVTSIQFAPNGAVSFMAGSTFSLYGIAQVGTTPAVAPKADGGNVIGTDGTYWYHAFLSNGTFTPQVGLTCDVLAVAGGGGGGQNGGGGGGAGGYKYTTSLSISSSQAVTVGAGGAQNTSGVASSVSTVSATGGGSGANFNGAGATGGSGGGGAGSGSGGSGTSGQGFAGGNGFYYTPGSTPGSGGGGGGAGAVGSNAIAGSSTEGEGGNGGAGINTYSAITSNVGLGVSGFIAGGGGGGNRIAFVRGTGGSGGGGNGAILADNAIAGVVNTGSGGGGAGDGGNAGAGGSGFIIIRYPVA